MQIMTKVFSLLFCLVFLYHQSSYGQSSKILNQNISIVFQKDSLSLALLKLQSVVQGNFAFDPLIIPQGKYIKQSFVKKNLGQILDQILEGTNLTYTAVGKALVIIKKPVETYTINGHIRDKDTGEELIGASIYITSLRIGAVTNQYGFYSITIPKGYYELVISYLGYNTTSQYLQLNHNLLLDHNLSGKIYNLTNVHIEPNITDSIYAQTSAKNVSPKLLNGLVYYAGEVDVVKALQMQSGIKAMTEASSGLFVRGGNNDQNLITLDEAMIYNPSHLFGLVSVFNSDAIKNIKIYDDHMPANFGGRLSSVLDVRMADGNNKEFHVNGGASLLSIRAAAEGPIKKEIGSFLITFRRSLIDLLNQNFKIVNPNSTYYDLNVKANYQVNMSNRIFYSFYYGNDYLSSKNSYVNNWGNATSTFRWNHKFNSRLFFNLSAIYSNYNNLLDVNADTISEKYRWKTGIKDMSLKGDFSFYKKPLSEIQFGGITTLHQLIPGEATNAFPIDFNIPRDKAMESSLYISHQLSIKNKFRLNYGLRAGFFSNGEERTDLFDNDGNKLKAKNYSEFIGLEPRFYLSFALNHDQRLHTTYNHNYQYLQLIQNNELAFSSLETWMSSTKSTKPQRSDYWSTGYDYFSAGNRFSMDIYYKRMYNQLDLINHAQIIKNPDIRNQLRAGKANAYGLNMHFSKTMENFIADASYSFSRVFRKIKDINDGDRFPANYDIPHDFKLTMSYFLNNRFSISSFFNYSTGRVVTLPVGYYQHEGIQVPIFEKRNESRFPDFHRLDLAVQYHLSSSNVSKHNFTNAFSAGIYNVYNKKNPLFYRVKQPSNSDSLFEFATGIMPWATYSFKF
ncbi:MAG TPA: hypothetical protein DIT07_00635 [Sphingobacteriaceae bacterium]|nr:hypothetical protein [Sphingobacteriaceae bacterium]